MLYPFDRVGRFATGDAVLDRVWDTPALLGTLDIELSPTEDPNLLVGQSIPLFKWSSPLPSGNQFTTITSDPRLSLDLSSLYTAGTVTILAVPEPGSVVLLGGVATLLVRRRSRRRQGAETESRKLRRV